MQALIVNDLPLAVELDNKAMTTVHGGNGGAAPTMPTTTSAPAMSTTTSTTIATPTQAMQSLPFSAVPAEQWMWFGFTGRFYNPERSFLDNFLNDYLGF
ncbi:hypothetical protein [Noviherbaspirillum saxi]|uniref:Uncharacterized protein n=1 Tax=Noviherbaspirillum saxi TaxID=2320863 RepID=A0A3A3FV24_9BURK|nr:hypothetical protein [Noviherbaspirillum saxi]RJF98408.1 hypothetical protein D3871_07730 [Noviherbaspirillum saxi]